MLKVAAFSVNKHSDPYPIECLMKKMMYECTLVLRDEVFCPILYVTGHVTCNPTVFGRATQVRSSTLIS